jgi:hypothetical protein
VLVNASMSPGATSSTSQDDATCASTSSTGDAYELTGGREHDMGPLVGHRIQISGMLKPAKLETTVGTSGTEQPRPTGGFDPLGQDLRLREINVTAFGDITASAAPAVQETAPPPAPAQPETTATGTSGTGSPQPTGTTGTGTLPATASDVPLAGVIGFWSLAGALALRILGRRRAG